MPACLLWERWARRESISIFLCLVALTAFYTHRALKYIPRPIATDAELVYLPYAKRLLAEGISFLMLPESVYVPPVTYMWPALFGGEAEAVKIANLLAGIVMIFLCYGIGKRAHSPLAGLVVALLFTNSPLLISWIPTPLSEPPFYLFTLIWLWGIGEVMVGNRWATSVAVAGLALSILTRSVWLYPSILLIVVFAGLSLWRTASRTTYRRLVLIQLLGVLPPAVVILKNLVLFDMPAIDTGTGGALYYGANIVTAGFEPPLLGLNYEDGGDSRSFVGNSEHALVAMQFFNERTWTEIVDWYLQKVSWIVLFTKLEAPMSWSVWRILELAFSATALRWAVKHKQPLTLLLVGGVVLQILQTSFVLYNIRYSIDNVELLLVPLAAIGVVITVFTLWSDFIAVRTAKLSCQPSTTLEGLRYLALCVTVFLGLYVALKLRVLPTINLPPQVPVWELFTTMRSASQTEGSSSVGDLTVIKFNVPALTIPLGSTNAIWQFNISIKGNHGNNCKKASAYFQETSQTGSAMNSEKIYFDVVNDEAGRNYYIGTAYKNAALFPSKEGSMILTINCGMGSDVRLNRAALIVPRIVEKYFMRDTSDYKALGVD